MNPYRRRLFLVASIASIAALGPKQCAFAAERSIAEEVTVAAPVDAVRDAWTPKAGVAAPK